LDFLSLADATDHGQLRGRTQRLHDATQDRADHRPGLRHGRQQLRCETGAGQPVGPDPLDRIIAASIEMLRERVERMREFVRRVGRED
jgi:hypothetical protein